MLNTRSISLPIETHGSVKELSAHQQLTIFILFESWNRKSSWWKEYIASLPPLSDFKGMPILWTRHWQNQLPQATQGVPFQILKLNNKTISLKKVTNRRLKIFEQ